MGRGVPAADSSSPSARPTLTAVEFLGDRTGTGGELRAKLVLSDGSFLFVPAQAVTELGLDPALSGELSEAVLAGLRGQAELLAARDKALALLEAAPQAQAALRLKLRRRGFGPEAVDQTAAWLAARGLLDDRRFAESWILTRLERHPEGRGVLIAGLRRRGVTRAVAEEVVRFAVDAEAEREAARRLLDRLRRRASSPEELSRRLAARGFSRSLVRSLLGEAD